MEKMKWRKSAADFIQLVRIMEGDVFTIGTGEQATRDEIAQILLGFIDFDLGGYPDYKTLELCAGDSDFAEQLDAALAKRNAEWKPGSEN